MYGPTMIGDRVRLKPPSDELAGLYRGWFADMEVNLYTLRFPPSLKTATSWIEEAEASNTHVLWMITVDGRTIGTAQVDTISWHHRRADIAMIIGEKGEWGKGYGTEVVRLITRFAFEDLNLEKLIGEAIIDNVGSVRAMEKAGYRQWGLARRHFYQDGHWSDAWFGEALRDEWVPQAATP